MSRKSRARERTFAKPARKNICPACGQKVRGSEPGVVLQRVGSPDKYTYHLECGEETYSRLEKIAKPQLRWTKTYREVACAQA